MPRSIRTVPVAVLVVIAALCGAFGGASRAGAQESGTLAWGISPATAEGGDTRSAIQRVVEPGQSLVEHVLVENFSEEPISLEVYAADAVVADGGFDLAAREDQPVRVGAWVAPEVTRVDLPAREAVVVPVAVTIPADAEPGDHAGGIVASRTDGGGTEVLALETERRVGTRVYLRVAGPITPGVAVEGLDADHRSGFATLGPGSVVASVAVRNTGNVRVSGYVEVTVRGPFGVLERSARGAPVEDLLPGQLLEEDVTVDGVWPLVHLDVEARFVVTGSVGQALEGLAMEDPSASTSVWALPWLLIVVVIGAVGYVVVRRVRTQRRGTRGPESALDGGSGEIRDTEPVADMEG